MQKIRKALFSSRKKTLFLLSRLNVKAKAYTSAIKLIARHISYLLTKQEVKIIALYEHIGDIISCEPVIEYVSQNNPKTKIYWAVKKDYAELLECHPKLAGLLRLDSFYEWILLRKALLLLGFKAGNIVDLHIEGKGCTIFKEKLNKGTGTLNFKNYLNNKNLLQAFTISAGLQALNSQPVFYINQEKKAIYLPGRFVVFHTQSNMDVKDWNDADWNCLTNFCINRGLYVVEVGINKHISISSEKYINYTGKKSLQVVADLINNASFFVGIDSGFAHMSNALQKDGLVLIGQYKVDDTVFTGYNPFSGLYSNNNYIVYADNNIVSTISCSQVQARLSKKLGFNE